MYKRIEKCRICGNDNLVSFLNLGEQALTGVFPKSKNMDITSGPLELVKCHSKSPDDSICNLVQLQHSYDGKEMYGLNYGYRSGLNQSMVKHLRDIVDYILSFVSLSEGDLVVDIGSNDSTLLQSYQSDKALLLTGIDPTGAKFKAYYPNHIQLIPEFFSADAIKKKHHDKKAKVISSIAMIYDLDDPVSFVKQVYQTLEDDGIWVFEQSYLPLMIEHNAYDTICHEHLEYYSLMQIKYMMDNVGFKIIDVELNDTNGGSFRTCVAKTSSAYTVKPSVSEIFKKEMLLQYELLATYEEFSKNTMTHKAELTRLVSEINARGEKIFGYGASTKGNVILQYCNFTANDIPYIAELNEDKFGSYTPFTHIPIISEQKAREMKPDYFLALPWHFRDNILEREKEFIQSGGKFIFPLPKIEIVGK